VILATRRSGNREYRMASNEWGSSVIPPYPGWSPGFLGTASTQQVTGLPAVMAAIRLNAETLSSLPLVVYEGRAEDRVRAVDSWQWALLHDESDTDCTTVNLYSDISASLDIDGNFFGLKVKDPRGRVIEIVALSPHGIEIRLVAGEKTFLYRDAAGGRHELTSADILHVRGFSAIPGSLRGMSPIEQHRRSLTSALALETYQGAFFRNSAQLGGVIKVPGRLNEDQARELLSVFEIDHAGPGNVGSTAVLHSGAEWQQTTLSQIDAQYVESRKLAIGDVARIFRVPVSLLDDAPDATSPEAEAERYLKFGIGPRLKLIEKALAADADLFAGTDLYPEFLVDALLRASTRERYEAYRAARQAGWLSPNEIRALENYPPIEGGDEIQITPVGGAPNVQDGPVAPAANGAGTAQDGNGAMGMANEMASLVKALRSPAAAPRVHLRHRS
jgi:HK97 family phage portal protein